MRLKFIFEGYLIKCHGITHNWSITAVPQGIENTEDNESGLQTHTAHPF